MEEVIQNIRLTADFLSLTWVNFNSTDLLKVCLRAFIKELFAITVSMEVLPITSTLLVSRKLLLSSSDDSEGYSVKGQMQLP